MVAAGLVAGAAAGVDGVELLGFNCLLSPSVASRIAILEQPAATNLKFLP